MTIYEIKSFPDGLFPNIKIDYDNHDKTCSSIPYMWLGHTGGVSDLWGQEECEGCDVTFYLDGLSVITMWDDIVADTYETKWCNCCYRKFK